MRPWCLRPSEGRGWCLWAIPWTEVSMFLWSVFFIHLSLKMPNPWKPSIRSPSSRPRWRQSDCFVFFSSSQLPFNCLLHLSIFSSNCMPLFNFLQEYNATIEFYWAPFLLESNSDDAVIHRVSDRIVRKGSINKHGKYWKGVDILVFNTYLWWMTGLKMKIL